MIRGTNGGGSLLSPGPVFKGASIKYVHAEGEGMAPKVDVELELSKGGCMNLHARGRSV